MKVRSQKVARESVSVRPRPRVRLGGSPAPLFCTEWKRRKPVCGKQGASLRTPLPQRQGCAPEVTPDSRASASPTAERLAPPNHGSRCVPWIYGLAGHTLP